MPKKAVVLLSGGLDSTTVLAIAKHDGFAPYALSFRYGQRHETELAAAARVASALGAAEHVIADVDLHVFGGSALTAQIDVPKQRTDAEMREASRSPTFPPETRSSSRSRSPGPKCSRPTTSSSASTPSTTAATRTAGRSTSAPSNRWPTSPPRPRSRARQRIQIHAPLIELTKAQIIQRGLALGVDYGITHSCYDPDSDGRACGACDSCLLRRKGFREAGVPDPTDVSGAPRSRRMTYTVKEIFYTLQGEGAHTGRPAVFCRFSGCNLWTGREEDRATRDLQLLRHRLRRRRPRRRQVPLARRTRRRGGAALAVPERARQALRRLHRRRAAAATRQRRSPPCTSAASRSRSRPTARSSPLRASTGSASARRPARRRSCRRGQRTKARLPPARSRTGELRGRRLRPVLPPADGRPGPRRNTQLALDYCLAHPQWRLSLQTHKFVGIR